MSQTMQHQFSPGRTLREIHSDLFRIVCDTQYVSNANVDSSPTAPILACKSRMTHL